MKNLSAVIYKGPTSWLGVCIEHVLVCAADTQAQVFAELEWTVQKHVKICAELRMPPFDGLPPAPDRYHVMHAQAAWRADLTIETDAGPVVLTVGGGAATLPEVRRG